MGIEYASEKLVAAVHGMAASARSIQDRVQSAYLTFHPIRPERDFPTRESRERYDRIMELITADKSDEARGYVPTTVSKMSDEQAEEVARLIVDLADHVNAARR
jgi:hypothetical protein